MHRILLLAVVLLAGPFVVRVVSDTGELVIEADSPEIQVVVKRHGGKPVEKIELRQGRGKTSLFSGDYEIEIVGARADDFRIKNQEFTLRRNGKVMVTIAHQATQPRRDPPPKPTKVSQGRIAWPKIISAETIETEVKLAAAELKKSATTHGDFAGGGYRTARVRFNELAMLFAIISRFDGQVRWKVDAPPAAAAFGRVADHCKVSTIQVFDEASVRMTELNDMLRGEAFAGRADKVKVDHEDFWPDRVSRVPLMMRMEQTFKTLRQSSARRGDFEKKATEIVRGAELIAAIGMVIHQAGMEDAGEEDYAAVAKSLSQHATAAAQATTANNFDGARKAIARMGQSCVECHQQFR